MVLLKHYTIDAFTFYTNYCSRKGSELESNPRAALCFYWGNRQVRVEGIVERESALNSDEYFASRPRNSQIGAIVSKQSEQLSSINQFQLEIKQTEHEYDGRVVSRPSNWGGYRIVPLRIEFWQEGEGRLHVRTEYSRKDANSPWQQQLLYP